jgi:hypothetical protein
MSRRFVESFFPSSTHYLATSSSSAIAHAYASLFVPWWFITNEKDDDAVDVFCSSEVTLSIPVVTPLDAVAWITNTTAASSISSSSIATIRNPALCVWAASGALYGWRCSMTLYRHWRLRNCDSGVVVGSDVEATNENRPLLHHAQQSPSTLLLSLAFAGYGIMNAVAIPLHCFLPVDRTVVLPLQYPLLWTMDTFWTGAFSTAIIFAVWQEYLETSLFSTRGAGQRLHHMFLHTWGMLCACLICIVGLGGYCLHSVWSKTFITSTNAVKDDDDDESVAIATLPLELWYLLPLLLAIVVVAVSFRKASLGPSNRDSRAISPAWMGAMALAMAVFGLLADASACQCASRLWTAAGALHGSRTWWQSLLLDTLRAPAVAFGACNLSFVSLYQRTRQRPQWRLATNQTKLD